MTTEIDSPEWLKLRSAIYIRDKGICWVCNSFVKLCDYDLGHLVDRCMNGTDTYDNVAVMHKRCNLSKPHHTTLEEATKWRLTATYQAMDSLPILNSLSYEKRIPKIRKGHISKPKLLSQEKLNKIQPLTITWIQGKARWFLPPREDGSYHKEDKFACGSQVFIEGCIKTGDRYSSPYDTIEIIGETEQHKFNGAVIEFGISIAKINRINGELKMEIFNDKTKANIIGINRYSTFKRSKNIAEIEYDEWQALLWRKGILSKA
jgi:hypothetical protein